MAYIIS